MVEYLQRGLAISREIHDRRAEAAFLNNLSFCYTDIAVQRRCLEEAAAIFEEIGDTRRLGLLKNNLSVLYFKFGLYHRALRYASEAVEIVRRMRADFDLANHLYHLAESHVALGNIHLARAAVEEGIRLAEVTGDPTLAGFTYPLLQAELLLKEGRAQEALEVAETVKMDQQHSFPLEEAAAYGLHAEVLLQLNDLEQADQVSALAIEIESTHSYVPGNFVPQDIYWQRYKVLLAKQRARGEAAESVPEEAWQVLQEAHRLMLEQIAIAERRRSAAQLPQ
jgi:tetratricopeptide (TPR) repeat protein